MSLDWIAQATGIAAFCVGISAFFHRNERRFKGQLAISSGIIGIHFFLMGAHTAGYNALFNTSRTVISMYSRHAVLMVLFIVLSVSFGLYSLKHPIELLPIIATVIATWAFFRTQGLQTRYILWCATALWTIHNVWLGSIGGSLMEGSFLIVNGWMILRFRRMQKEGIDPFAPTIKDKP